jgi:hypothetical protein
MELKISTDEPLPEEKSEKKHCKPLQEFISHTESAICKIKPNA